TDDSPSLEHLAERFLCLGPAVVLHQVVLAPALEPNARRLLDSGEECVGISDLPVLREQYLNVSCPGGLPPSRARPVLTVRLGAACMRHVDDERVRATRCLDEPGVNLRSHRAAADDDDGALRRPDLCPPRLAVG